MELCCRLCCGSLFMRVALSLCEVSALYLATHPRNAAVRASSRHLFLYTTRVLCYCHKNLVMMLFSHTFN